MRSNCSRRVSRSITLARIPAGEAASSKALDARSGADFLSYDMAAAPYNVSLLSEYMEGLVAGGPTKAVIERQPSSRSLPRKVSMKLRTSHWLDVRTSAGDWPLWNYSSVEIPQISAAVAIP